MLSSVLRGGSRSQAVLQASARYTPKRDPDRRAAYKNAVRLRNVPKYTFENSLQKETHRWMNDKRIRAMGRTVENAMNTSRLTEKIDPKSMKEFMTKMKELEKKLYWEKLHFIQLTDQYNQSFNRYFDEEIMNLPGYLKSEYEIGQKHDREYAENDSGIPEEYNPENIYWEQTMRLHPEEEAKMIALRFRVRKLLEGRLMEDE